MIQDQTFRFPDHEGDLLLGHAADVAVAAVDGAVARGRIQRRLRRALRWISQKVGVGLGEFLGRMIISREIFGSFLLFLSSYLMVFHQGLI